MRVKNNDCEVCLTFRLMLCKIDLFSPCFATLTGPCSISFFCETMFRQITNLKALNKYVFFANGKLDFVVTIFFFIIISISLSSSNSHVD